MAFGTAITALFGADTTGLQKAAGDGERIVEKFGAAVRTGFASMRASVDSFVTRWAEWGAAGAVAAFVALSKGAIDLAGKLSDTSANIGINVESLQALEAQHKRNGVSEEQLTQGLEKTKAAVIAAAEGDDKASEALAKLGLKAAELIKLPLDLQYEAIAKAAAAAANQNEAYAAVASILGEKVGPKLMGSLSELAEQGLPGVVKSAKEAGHVLTAETVASLDKAGDAIDDFKRRATVAVGNIIVNFQSEEGLKLLLFQFLGVCAKFTGTLVDGIVETGGMIKAVFTGAFVGVTNLFRDGLVEALKYVATGINEVLPSKWQIDIVGLDALKSTGEGVADSISRAIAATEPSKLKAVLDESWTKTVAEQQKVVDALNKVDLRPEADKLREAGAAMKTSLDAGGQSVKKSITEGADALKDAGKAVSDEIQKQLTAIRSVAGTLVQQGSFEQTQGTTTVAALEAALARAQAYLEYARTNVGEVGGGARYDAAVSQVEQLQKNIDHAKYVGSRIGGSYGAIPLSELDLRDVTTVDIATNSGGGAVGANGGGAKGSLTGGPGAADAWSKISGAAQAAAVDASLTDFFGSLDANSKTMDYDSSVAAHTKATADAVSTVVYQLGKLGLGGG